MKVFYKKGRSSIVLMLVLAMLLQIVGPVVGDYVYAVGMGEGFRVVDTRIEGEVATVDWEYKFTPNVELKHNIPVDFILAEDEEISGELESEEGVIGEYRISKDGEMTVKIDEELVEELLGVGEPEDEETVPLVPVTPVEQEPEEPEIDGEDNLNQTPEGETGEETTTEPETNGEEEIEEDDSARIIDNLLGLFSKNVVYADGTDGEVEPYTFTGSFEVEGVSLKSAMRSSVMPFDVTEEVDEDIITKITATVDDEELKDIENYRPTIGDKVDLKIDFKLDADHNYGNGSKLTYDLPTPLKAVSGTGDLMKDGEQYGTYKVDDGKVIIEFNDNIRFQGEEGSGGLETIGDFSITAEYFKGEGDNSLETDLELPGQEIITINFKPKNGTTITKKVDKTNVNNIHELTWTVMVNTEMEDLGIGVKFEDKLSNGHTYKQDSLEVYKLNIGADGNVIGNEEDVSDSFLGKLNQDGLTGFELSLTGKFAYKIVYKTILDDEKANNNGELKVKNEAEFKGEKKPVTSTITYGKPLEKTVAKDEEKANWKITVNANKKSIDAGLKITDTWDANMKKYHELDEAKGIVVKKGAQTLVENTHYTIAPTDGGGFVLTFTNAIDDVHTIEYTTIPKDLITKGFTITNKVVRGDNKGGDNQGADTSYGQNVIKKAYSDLNYQNKTVKWTIVINSAGYTMKNLVLKDVFTNKNLKVSGDIEVKSNGTALDPSKYEIKHKDENGDYVSPNQPTKFGFDIVFNETVTGKITVTFTTEYDVKGATNLDKYKNVGIITWGENNEYESEDSAEVIINNQQKAKGYKEGSYNYGEKKFYWDIGINYNFDTISNAVFTDTLPESQVIDSNSITVHELNLSEGGNGKITGNALVKGTDYTLEPTGNNKFTITFTNTNSNAIDKPYRISYESTIKDYYYEPSKTNPKTKYSVRNEAKLIGDNEYNGTWDKDVTVDHSESLILKGVKMTNPATAKLEWELKLNYNQSILNNVKITDIVGKDGEGNPNQKIYEDSFKIYPVTFSGTSSTAKVGTTPIDSSLYDLKVSEEGFTIDFEGSISAAYLIKYETYFLGAPKDELKNEATLSYTTRTGTTGEDKGEYINANFNFSGSAFTKKGQLQITKVDADDESIKLSGAEFKLYSAQTGGFLIETVSTDEKGVYTFKTKVGQTTYWLQETKAPEGYSLGDSEYKNRKAVKIEDTGDPATPNYVEKIVVENKEIHQAVKLIKVDEDDQTIKLLGAKFELYKLDDTKVTEDADGTPLKELVTDEKGELVVNNLPKGNYYFKEVGAPDNYILPTGNNANSQVFEIKENQITLSQVTLKNTRGNGKITITKVDAGNNNIKLEGAEFKLTDTDRKEYGVTENADKTLTFDNLEYGIYYLVEIKAPEGYTLVSKPIEIKLDGETNDIDLSVTVRNTKKISVTGTKEWIDGSAPRPTVWFKLYRSIGGSNPVVAVEEAEIMELKDGIKSVIWKDLDKVDENGDDYIYSVKEVNEGGEDYTPENYEKAENGLEITNYYVSPKNASVKAIKNWVNGSNNRPTIWFKLYRKIEGGAKEDVPLTEAPIKELKSGTIEVVWNELTKTDSNRNEYIFSIEEVDREGNKYTPKNYEKFISEDGLTITNRYNPPYYPPTGGGGGGPTRPTDPTKPVDPVEPTDPEDPVEIQEVPKKPEDPIKETTPKDTPKEGEVEVPKDSEPKITTPPTNGTVTIDPNGKWTYTPNPGFVGKDSFTITITHPDGTEEEIFVEIDVDEPPLGTIDSNSTTKGPIKTLPKTGEIGRLGFYISGLLFIILGIFLTRRRTE